MSYRDLKHPTSRKNFAAVVGQNHALILTHLHSVISALPGPGSTFYCNGMQACINGLWKGFLDLRNCSQKVLISLLASGLELFSHNVRTHIPPIMYQFVRRHLAVCFLNPQLFSTKNRMWTQMIVFAEVKVSQTIFNSMPLPTLIN